MVRRNKDVVVEKAVRVIFEKRAVAPTCVSRGLCPGRLRRVRQRRLQRDVRSDY